MVTVTWKDGVSFGLRVEGSDMETVTQWADSQEYDMEQALLRIIERGLESVGYEMRDEPGRSERWIQLPGDPFVLILRDTGAHVVACCTPEEMAILERSIAAGAVAGIMKIGRLDEEGTDDGNMEGQGQGMGSGESGVSVN